MAMTNNHYYTNEPSTPHDIAEWVFELKGKRFNFTTDSGVFSKKTVDFGSRLLIETFSEEQLPAGAILDVGCGYGPMGLALAFDSERPVEMVDINQRAVALARQNAEKNGIKNVEIYESNIYENVKGTAYAAIVSNPPIRAGKQVVHEILTGAFSRLATSGTLTVVIQKKQGAPSAAKKMAEVFGNVETLAKDKGYFILQSVKF